MKRPCYVPSKNYKVRVIAKNKVLNKLNIKTNVSISSSVIAARGASRGPRRVALIGRSPFLFFRSFSPTAVTTFTHASRVCRSAARRCLCPPCFLLFSPRFLVLRTSPLSPRDASGAIFHFSGKTGIMEASATVCLIKE